MEISSKELTLTDTVKAYLSETAKWAQFLSIIGFIAVGFLVFFAIVMSFVGGAMNKVPGYENLPINAGGFIGIAYLVVAILYFIPLLYQFQFASKMRLALNTTNNDVLNESFLKLKTYYKFLGIMTAAVVVLYIVLMVVLVAFSASLAI